MCNSLQTIGLLEQAEQSKEKWRDVTMECEPRLQRSLMGGWAFVDLSYEGNRVAYQYGNDNGAHWSLSVERPRNVRLRINSIDPSRFKVEERVA